jgi:formate hydrogenlyase subunit 3/multisubunit Na+/H+ antiporter MnhD subunit
MREYLGAIIGFVIVAALAILLLYLAASGSLPSGFGLFNMENLGVRVIVIIILVIATLGLFAAYNSVRKREK